MALLDPDRRSEGRRLAHPDDWSPSLPIALELCREAGLGCIKLPPGLDPMPRRSEAPRTSPSSGSRSTGSCANWRPGSAPGPSPAPATGRRAQALGNARSASGTGTRLLPIAARRRLAPRRVRPRARLAGLAREHGTRHGLRPVEGDATDGAVEPNPLGPALEGPGGPPRGQEASSCSATRPGIGPLTVKTRGVRESAQELARRLRGPGDLPGPRGPTPRGAVAAVLEALDETPPETPLVGDEGLEPPAPSL